MRKQIVHTYQNIISVENLLLSWREFLRGKRKKQDVQEFQHSLVDNVFQLHTDLKNKTYTHGAYHAFNISDPKPRNIHKASVCDRLLHHAIYRTLYPFFHQVFITDSYSCRVGKGTHKAIDKKIIPALLAKNKDSWYSKYDLESRFNVNHHAMRRFIKQGVLKPRIIPNEGGKPYVHLFLIKDNKDTLPPKKLTESHMVKETKDGKDYYHTEPWYRFEKDPWKYLEEYKIMDYLQPTETEKPK